MQVASGNEPPPGGMPGGRLVVSSNGTTPGTGVVWGVYPVQGNANSKVVHGALVAYDERAEGTLEERLSAALLRARASVERGAAAGVLERWVAASNAA